MIKKHSFFMAATIFMSLGILAAALVGCSSSSGGGSPASAAPSYTGATSQAAIDASNAEEIAEGAYGSALAGSKLPDLTGAVRDAGDAEHFPYLLPMVTALKDTVLQSDILSHETFYGAAETSTDTLNGDCGGTAVITVTADSETGVFSGSINFSSYCSGDVYLSGDITISGTISGSTIQSLIISFSSLNLSYNSQSIMLNGDINGNISTTPYELTMNLTLSNTSSGKIFKIEDYVMTLTDSSGSSSFTLSGKFYHPDYGYGEVTTTTDFVVESGDDWPSSGVLVVTGSGGSKAKLTALSSTTYQVEADTNGDGNYDWNSGPLSWADM